MISIFSLFIEVTFVVISVTLNFYMNWCQVILNNLVLSLSFQNMVFSEFTVFQFQKMKTLFKLIKIGENQI